ncbi:MAG: tRNA (N(6)-L-threonylcarbamoyladenosine(37)-C(2))-methylthiotransferase MtaB [Acidiferrobacterales bacterium]|nr:tRNA (N(6)-L-threonylcarbamoyladenosine(37)-C(2))-methylthiotransferase MtaB [Acidiferrobacterales bacterium]
MTVPNETNSPSVSIETLGCKVNLFESEYIYHQLQSDDWNRAGDGPADLCVINTCTVTREADRQSRQVIRRAIRNNPDATIVVTGCYAEMQREKCAEIEGVDLVVPGTEKLRIPEIISRTLKSGQPIPATSSDRAASMPIEAVAGFESRTRAYLQVQQGCDNGCTFCIIHEARGASRSVLPTTVTRQVERYVRQGFREVVVCGIDLGAYGTDLSAGLGAELSLSSLLRELATRHPDLRFRLSSIDPAHVSSDLISVFDEFGNVCPHLHLSLQSMSPIILKRMKRRYTPEDVFHAAEAMYRTRPDLVISADVMVGFPTESDDDFERTRRALHELEVSYPHIFAYSERDGTPAARIPRQVPHEIRKQRAQLLRYESREIRSKTLRRFVGHRVKVLVENVIEPSSGLTRSRMANFIPVYFRPDDGYGQTYQNVEIAGMCRDGLQGMPVAEDAVSFGS